MLCCAGGVLLQVLKKHEITMIMKFLKTKNKHYSLSIRFINLKAYQVLKHCTAIYIIAEDFTAMESYNHFIILHGNCEVNSNYYSINDTR